MAIGVQVPGNAAITGAYQEAVDGTQLNEYLVGKKTFPVQFFFGVLFSRSTL
jgi:hypothetical protein